MKKIINGLVYDTAKSDVIYTDYNKRRTYYVTRSENRHFFIVYDKNHSMAAMTEEAVKDLLADKDVDKYIELFGSDDIEEA